jgi:Xaa-Pro aminopeptidase
MSEPALSILHEKADQAAALLRELGLDAWMTFVRETATHPDPGVELVVGVDLTWVSALLLTARGDRVAVVGRMDVSNVQARGVFGEVIGYDQDVRAPLRDVLSRLDPQTIALNYSPDDHTADGLTLGMYRLLADDLLADTPLAARLTTAAPLLARLRGRKTATEVACLRGAIAETEAIVSRLGGLIRPGLSEREIAGAVHEQLRVRGLAPAWPAESCPLVNTGPHSEPGHSLPRDDLRVEPGHLVHIDLGVRRDGYCSDLQRMWYVRRTGETEPPESVRKGFATVLRAIESAAAVLKPGVRGWEVDSAARRVVVEAGYPEYRHGTGHSLGRAVHDGGTMLGPPWPKYGATTERQVEPGNVFTLELGVMTEAGYIGLEEDVLVTDGGCEFLSTPQRELWLI